MKDTFLHPSCALAVCEDCQIMAEEYARLLEGRTERIYWLEQRHDLMQYQIDQLKREVAFWKETATLGYSEIIQGYLQTEAEKAFKAGRAAEKRRLAAFERKIKAFHAKVKETKGRVEP